MHIKINKLLCKLILAVLVVGCVLYKHSSYTVFPEDTWPFLKAIINGDQEAIQAVYNSSPSLINQIDSDGNGVLHIACQTANSKQDGSIVWFLLDNFADAQLLNNFKETAILQVMYITNTDRRVEYINYLVKHGAPINQRNIHGEHILDKFVKDRNIDSCQSLMDWFLPMIDADAVSKAMILAGAQAGQGFGFTEIYAQLAKKRGDVYAGLGEVFDVNNGMNTLMMAAIKGDPKIVMQLLAKKVPMNLRSQDRWGYSALDFAVMQQNVPIVQLLLKNGANSAQKNKYGQYCLYRVLAIKDEEKKKELALLLCNKGININDKDISGDTILHRVARDNDSMMMELLVAAYGPQIQFLVTGADGLTVVQIVDRGNFAQMKEILRPLAPNI
jgi:ankyrin repeat protein